jgi:hypothetical protein
MTNEFDSPSDWADETTLDATRELYRAPAGDLYWRGLESRIMKRISAAQAEWWSFFGGWVRVGLAAAAIAAVVAGAALARSREAKARIAYESAIEDASGVPVAGPVSARASGRDTREATLRYVMSY